MSNTLPVHYTVLLPDYREGTLSVTLSDTGLNAELTTDDGEQEVDLGTFTVSAQQLANHISYGLGDK